MTLYRFQCTLPHASGIPADAVTNTWYGNCADDADAESFADNLAGFYGIDSGTDGVALSEFFASSLSRTVDACFTKIYDMTDPEPRVPVATHTFTLQAYSTITSPPAEVAACLSFKATPVSGEVAARQRGRIYLGPLNMDALATDPSSGEVRLGGELITKVQESVDDHLGGAAGPHVIYSPTATGEGGLVWFEVATYWMDNAPDTQRRRGIRSSARVSWPVL
jgi:hypothetical protein